MQFVRYQRDTGFFGKIFRKVKKAVGGVAKSVIRAATLPVRIVTKGPKAIIDEITYQRRKFQRLAPMALQYAGGALGSVVPVVGTAAGSALGRFGGSLLSSVAAGKLPTLSKLRQMALGSLSAGAMGGFPGAAFKMAHGLARGRSLGGVLGSAAMSAAGNYAPALASQVAGARALMLNVPGAAKMLRALPSSNPGSFVNNLRTVRALGAGRVNAPKYMSSFSKWARQRREVGALAEGGTVYIVEAGDSPWQVAQEITGDGNRYRELFAANPTYALNDKKDNFKYFPAGRRLVLPTSWVASGSLEPPDGPLTPTAPAPSAIPTIPLPVPGLSLPSPWMGGIVSPDQQRDAQSILSVWAATDGASELAAWGLNDYGMREQDVRSSWVKSRDGVALKAFISWANGKLPAAVMQVTDELNPINYAALVAWSNSRPPIVPEENEEADELPTAPEAPAPAPAAPPPPAAAPSIPMPQALPASLPGLLSGVNAEVKRHCESRGGSYSPEGGGVCILPSGQSVNAYQLYAGMVPGEPGGLPVPGFPMPAAPAPAAPAAPMPGIVPAPSIPMPGAAPAGNAVAPMPQAGVKKAGDSSGALIAAGLLGWLLYKK